ncbi:MULTISPECIES: retropepsin-like aspartic protease [Asticcacaulis]|uniref:retropepsin-like aspartic protease n=1 Tax=Asticcacaulis TaxID=76890 RepID=UPI001AEA883E|nr:MULTISPECIES: retropepsin-like aspartic protease [Asticcacaulis]MBP2160439.1 putative aspartyl protease [Asticcacaulis solisilvae]MDR6801484.1 putative aspartyl protease [Asticcacaulis sp. BE141]
MTNSDGGWPRRGLLAAGLGLGLMPPTALSQVVNAQGARQLESDGKKGVRLTAREDPSQRLTIEVMINGKGPFRFVVDTAAERSILSDDVAARLGLSLGRNVMVSGLTRRVPAPTVQISDLAFGPFRRSNLSLPVLPRASVYNDGYLGLDVINDTRVTFDFADRAIRIEEPSDPTEAKRPDVTHVRAKGSGGYLKVMDCLVDSVAAIAFIDTGAEVSVGNVSLMKAVSNRSKIFAPQANVTLTGVTGGEITGQVVPIGRIRLQNLAFTNGTLVIADVPEFAAWKTKSRPSLLIGMDYLRQFASVTLDYRARDIRFELSLAPPQPVPGVSIETA